MERATAQARPRGLGRATGSEGVVQEEPKVGEGKCRVRGEKEEKSVDRASGKGGRGGIAWVGGERDERGARANSTLLLLLIAPLGAVYPPMVDNTSCLSLYHTPVHRSTAVRYMQIQAYMRSAAL